MDEFTEIGNPGHVFDIRIDNDQVSQRFTHTHPTKVVSINVCVSYNGEILDVVPFAGMGMPMIYPKPSILTFLLSDEQGMFGRSCPKCVSYFRTEIVKKNNVCPYCGHSDHMKEFTTENQKRFMDIYCETYSDAINTGRSISINVDEIVAQLPENTSTHWNKKEEIQQTQLSCECGNKYDILGEYGICPSCSKHNGHHIIIRKIDGHENRFTHSDKVITDRHEREEEWAKLLMKIVADFEGYANELRKHLLKLPLSTKRRNDVGNISFQRILNANDKLLNWFGFEIMEGFSEDDKQFVNNCFNKRHLFTHNSGRVDQEYLDNTNDTTVRLNQLIRLRSRNILRLIGLVRLMAHNLSDGFHDIN